jgi:DNA primase catalytic subunit
MGTQMYFMFTRVLTDVERRHIAKYLKQNGKKQVYVRKIVYGARKHLPQIRADIELLENLLKTYEREKPR